MFSGKDAKISARNQMCAIGGDGSGGGRINEPNKIPKENASKESCKQINGHSIRHRNTLPNNKLNVEGLGFSCRTKNQPIYVKIQCELLIETSQTRPGH